MSLPTNEFMLMVTDIIHNYLNSRKYDTVAIGALGKNPFQIQLLLGINSSIYSETTLTRDRIIPPSIRNSDLVKTLNLQLTQEPYHAETSIVIKAKELDMKIFALTSSRKICDVCDGLLTRYSYLFDSDCSPVDGWSVNGKKLTQKDRSGITELDWVDSNKAIAIRE